MLGIIALEGAKQLMTGGIQERRKSQDFEWDFKLDFGKPFKETIQRNDSVFAL